MMLKTSKTVWDGHITMTPEKAKVTVELNGICLASSTHAILFCEGDRAPIYYIPISDVDCSHLVDSALLTYCKWKGEASYLSYKSDELTVPDILWKYENAHTPVKEIRDCVSFDATKTVISVSDVQPVS